MPQPLHQPHAHSPTGLVTFSLLVLAPVDVGAVPPYVGPGCWVGTHLLELMQGVGGGGGRGHRARGGPTVALLPPCQSLVLHTQRIDRPNAVRSKPWLPPRAPAALP